MLFKYLRAIKDIGRANANQGGSTFSNAVDMFLNNVKDANNPNDQYHYAGADYVDYASLTPKLGELSAGKDELVKFNTKHLSKINELYAAGKFDELAVFVEANR